MPTPRPRRQVLPAIISLTSAEERVALAAAFKAAKQARVCVRHWQPQHPATHPAVQLPRVLCFLPFLLPAPSFCQAGPSPPSPPPSGRRRPSLHKSWTLRRPPPAARSGPPSPPAGRPRPRPRPACACWRTTSRRPRPKPLQRSRQRHQRPWRSSLTPRCRRSIGRLLRLSTPLGGQRRSRPRRRQLLTEVPRSAGAPPQKWVQARSPGRSGALKQAQASSSRRSQQSRQRSCRHSRRSRRSSSLHRQVTVRRPSEAWPWASAQLQSPLARSPYFLCTSSSGTGQPHAVDWLSERSEVLTQCPGRCAVWSRGAASLALRTPGCRRRQPSRAGAAAAAAAASPPPELHAAILGA